MFPPSQRESKAPIKRRTVRFPSFPQNDFSLHQLAGGGFWYLSKNKIVITTEEETRKKREVSLKATCKLTFFPRELQLQKYLSETAFYISYVCSEIKISRKAKTKLALSDFKKIRNSLFLSLMKKKSRGLRCVVV